MKRTSIFYFSLAAIAAGSLASCEDYDPFDEETVREAAVIKEFTKNFENRYGKIDPNHDWGFKTLYISPSASLTRASLTRGDGFSGVGHVNVNINEWTLKQADGYAPGALIQDMDIPGWPNFNSKYYTQQTGGGNFSIFPSEPTKDDSRMPAGDVTDYEIQYVSNWFRTHKNPTTNVSLHLTDFFVQNVSGDMDRVESVTGKECNGEVINNVLGQGCSYGMDHLVFKTLESTDVNGLPDNTWTHLNDYNKSSTNLMNSTGAMDLSYSGINNYNNDNTHKRVIMYVTSSGTEDFAYHSSFGTDDSSDDADETYFKKYVLMRLTWKEDGVQREGYYLAFDYETKKDGVLYPGDGYYSNWIIKISPANYVPSDKLPLTRIFCEDLGNTFDFDFNDLVFDVKYDVDYNSSKVEAILTIQASGGTIPIYLGTSASAPNNPKYETHFLLGQSTHTIPVNVAAAGGVTHDVAIIRYNVGSITYGTDGKIAVNPNDIPIWVGNTNADLVNIATLLPASGKGESIAPQKISIPDNTTRWLKESQQIEWGYGYFDDWVKDENSHGFFSEEAWNKNHKQKCTCSNKDEAGHSEVSHLY